MQRKLFSCATIMIVAALSAAQAHAAEVRRSDKVSFYFAAHADDWQLFMNPSAFEDVTTGASKTVFVHITAGDAGLGISAGGRKHPFYLARENGAETAIRFMTDADNIPADKKSSQMTLNDHKVYRVAYGTAVSYFLRLPDGNGLGTGYAETGFQSLKRLSEGQIPSMAAVDGSSVYQGWGDLVATLRTIVLQERGPAGPIQVNVPELDSRLNPGDHSDHLMTAKAALEATNDMSCVRRVHYINYASSRLPDNLTAQQRDRESSVYAVTLSGILAFDHRVSWQHYDSSFVGRNYFRVEEPTGSCGQPATAVSAVKR
jgi:hypothetical protein